MIKSFACSETEKIFSGEHSIQYTNIEKIALRKLLMVDAASNWNDLYVPPSNNLELINGIASIRINLQYRLCFKWIDNDVYGVYISKHHKGPGKT